MLIEYGNTVVKPSWKLMEDVPTGYARIYYILEGDLIYEAADEMPGRRDAARDAEDRPDDHQKTRPEPLVQPHAEKRQKHGRYDDRESDLGHQNEIFECAAALLHPQS